MSNQGDEGLQNLMPQVNVAPRRYEANEVLLAFLLENLMEPQNPLTRPVVNDRGYLTGSDTETASSSDTDED